jgi:hypothetical protein
MPENIGMQTTQPHAWSEFEDRVIVDYKRVRSQIEHEDTLTNHRMTWLLTSNAFLFTGFALTLSAISKDKVEPDLLRLAKWLFTIIPILGLAVCYISGRVIDAALCQIRDLQGWWVDRLKTDTAHPHPPLIGSEGIPRHRRLLALGMPSLLAVAWVGILIGFHQLFIEKVLPEVLWPALFSVGAVGIFLAGWYARSRRSK